MLDVYVNVLIDMDKHFYKNKCICKIKNYWQILSEPYIVSMSANVNNMTMGVAGAECFGRPNTCHRSKELFMLQELSYS